MHIDVSKLDAANVNQNDGNTEKSAKNQNAITVEQLGNNVKVLGALSEMEEYDSTNPEQGKAKWIGLSVKTEEPRITSVYIDGTRLTKKDEEEAQSINLPDGTFILWLKAELLATTPRKITISTLGCVDKTMTFTFEDTSVISVPSDYSADVDGDLQIADLIEPGVTISWDGTTGTPQGTAKYVEDYSSAYSDDEKTGHFFPMKFSKDCYDEPITISGSNNGDKEITPTAIDPYLIIRIENLKENKMTAKKAAAAAAYSREVEAGDEIFTLDFSDMKLAPPVGEIAFNAEKSDYGKFGTNEAYYDGGSVEIAWDGTDATVTGTLNYIGRTGRKNYTSLKSDGNYFAFALNEYFKGKQITVDNGEKHTQASDTDFVCLVEDTKNKIVVKCDDTTIATFDLTGVTLKKPVGEDAVMVAGQNTNMDMVDKASVLIDKNVSATWEGNVAKFSGTVHWYDFTGTEHFKKKQSGHFLPIIVTGYDGEEISVTGSDGKTATLVDPKWVFRVDDFITKQKKAKINVGGVLIAELDFSKVTLEQPLGKYAVKIPAELNFGVNCGDAKDMCKDAQIEWNGVNGAVTGTFYKQNKANKYQCPIVLDKYFNAKPITVHVTADETLASLEWHNVLGDTDEVAKNATLTVKDEQTTLAVLTFTGATFVDEKAPGSV